MAPAEESSPIHDNVYDAELRLRLQALIHHADHVALLTYAERMLHLNQERL